MMGILDGGRGLGEPGGDGEGVIGGLVMVLDLITVGRV